MERNQVTEAIRRQAMPLQGEGDSQALVDAAGDAQFVLLGEASHGTSEYYRRRADLTKRLITEKGFSFLAAAFVFVDRTEALHPLIPVHV